METTYYKIGKRKICEQSSSDFERNNDKGVTHICDIGIERRIEAAELLQGMMLDGIILKSLLAPYKNLFFEFTGDFNYGELAYCSAGSINPVKYLGIIQYENSIILIRNEEESLIKEFFKSLPQMIDYPLDQTGNSLKVFTLILQFLSENGNQIINSREEFDPSELSEHLPGLLFTPCTIGRNL